MSTFVEIDPSEYDKDAFAGFDASTSDFRSGNALPLMWLSQLAYEAHRKDTVEEVALKKWGFTFAGRFVRPKTSVENSYETCGIIGERAGAVILAFAGTDPGVWQNFVGGSGRSLTSSSDGGFSGGAGSVARRSNSKTLMICGLPSSSSVKSFCVSPSISLPRNKPITASIWLRGYRRQ